MSSRPPHITPNGAMRSASSPMPFVATAMIGLLALLPQSVEGIMPTAAIDILLPGTGTGQHGQFGQQGPITLLASQASFGAVLAEYSQRYDSFSSFTNENGQNSERIPGVGVIPAFPPQMDPYLCNEAEGWTDYSQSSENEHQNTLGNYYQTAILVPRGQCSFQRKALSAQRLGAAAIIVYGSLSSRYSLNYTNTTDCELDAETGERVNPSCVPSNDAKTRSDYTRNDILWPGDKYDYDCNDGRASIPQSIVENNLDFLKMPGGYNEENDGFLSGWGEDNLCVRYDDAIQSGGGGSGNNKPFASTCESQRCLVTGKNTTVNGELKYEACCAWDLHIWLYDDHTIPKSEEVVRIPAVYITMREAAALLDLVRGNMESNGGNGVELGADPVVLTIYQRYRPEYNISAVLIWAFGVFVAWIASYHSSVEYRRVRKMILVERELKDRMESMESMGDEDTNVVRSSAAGNAVDGGSSGRNSGDNERQGSQRGTRSRSRSPPTSATATMTRSSSNVSSTERGEERTIYPSNQPHPYHSQYSQHPHDPDSLELTASHALGFIIMASSSLLILFFFKIYNVVKIMYAFGCSGALAQIVLHPFMVHVCKKYGTNGSSGGNGSSWGDWAMREVNWLTEEQATQHALRGGFRGHCLHCLWNFIGPFSPIDAASLTIAYAIGGIWLYVAFWFPHPDTLTFYWVIQDVFGLCMCMLFLSTIKLNAVRVGAVLLIVAFFYDIFFVFVTPLLTKHGESIMVNVATSGGPPKADPSWCEKYPWSADCRGGDPLPMLFAIPRIGDYQGGCSMLGLGDIVLPGLLLSFASRLDEAKRLIGVVGGGSGRVRSGACPDGNGGLNGWNGLGGKHSNSICAKLCCCFRQGYFPPVVVAYAIGLLMANAAVYLMEMGQPALLYLVPCCLGTMMFMAHKAGELQDLWEGPRVIRNADALMYGEPMVEVGEDDERDGAGNMAGGGGRGGGVGRDGVVSDGVHDDIDKGVVLGSSNNEDGSKGEAPLLQMT